MSTSVVVVFEEVSNSFRFKIPAEALPPLLLLLVRLFLLSLSSSSSSFLFAVVVFDVGSGGVGVASVFFCFRC